MEAVQTQTAAGGQGTGLPLDDRKALEDLAAAHAALGEQIGRRIVGQRQVVELMLTSLLANGHSLLVGVPGLAKTLLVSTLAEALDLQFARIQFTPDLMPADITGTEVLAEDKSTGERSFRFVPGPVFTQVLLADEINRSPPKTQAALLQSMQERQVTAGGRTHALPAPYLVFATQNPIEQEGTYPLPEAELDRFMFFIGVDYPDAAEEARVVQSTTAAATTTVSKVLGPERLLAAQALVRRVPVTDAVVEYAVRLARASRPGEPGASERVREMVAWGAGPRASQFLILGGKARALLSGRAVVSAEDVRALARPVLRHRVLTNFRAEVAGVSSLDIVEHLLETVKP
ncbi:MAG TPA: MoxR family ATPase [Myxococcota bacterium]|nr:MoxR family ATPase [Myxococcota bacterium]HRY94619.1 MoxR family ATPase [Myxococcota bacterium]HSA20225.1 MoxR family ATPase [Myxococcota bacterium]